MTSNEVTRHTMGRHLPSASPLMESRTTVLNLKSKIEISILHLGIVGGYFSHTAQKLRPGHLGPKLVITCDQKSVLRSYSKWRCTPWHDEAAASPTTSMG